MAHVPADHNVVSPYFVVRDAVKLIEFIVKVFDAKELGRLAGPGGSIAHAEVKIGDSVIMIGQPMGPDGRESHAMLHVYVSDVDAVYARALAAGAKSTRPPEDMFYGDRISMVDDPFGNQWAISTHKEDVSHEEMQKRAAAMKG